MSGSRRISDELLQKIKAAVNIVEVIGEHVVLRKSGTNYVGLCPFHNERTPSFNVSENKQLYHCYGCRKGGDILSFVREIHGLDFSEAVEELSERAHVKLPDDWKGGSSSSDDPEAQKRKEEAKKKLETSYRLNRFVAAFYHQNLSQFAHAARYLRMRGVNEEILRMFYLGYAPGAWDSLAAHLVSKKAPLPLAVELGLIRPSQRSNANPAAGTGYFDLFRNRTIFPILDMRGRVAGFGGRVLPRAENSEEEGPKYLNSPESPLFQKSKLAFGMYQAQKHIREKDEVILVEGYFDVLALHAMGFRNVVASCGTALSADHLSLFKRFTSRITILFDGDRAGITATERAMELGLSHGMVLTGAVMPEDQDPDEILFNAETGLPISGGKERMESILKEAKPLIDTRLEEAIRMAEGGPEARTQALKKIGGWLAKFNDPVGKEVRLQFIQDRLGVPRQLLLQAMGSGSGSGSGGRAPMIQGQQVSLSSQPSQPSQPSWPQSSRSSNGGPPGFHSPAQPIQVPSRGAPQRPVRVARQLNRVEKVLLSGIARGGGFGQQLAEAIGKMPPDLTIADLFDYPTAREFVLKMLTIGDDFGQFGRNPTIFLEEVQDSQVRQILTEALVTGEETLTKESFSGALDRAMARCWARFSQRIRAALSEAEVKKDAGLQSKLMKEYLDVQRKMKEFNSFYDED